MTGNKKKSSSEDAPQEMMKRVFAVAELIIRSDFYQKVQLQQQKKPQKTQN